MNPAPPYSRTDLGLAITAVLSVLLDVLIGYGVLPALDAATRTSLVASLTVIFVSLLGGYVYNRTVKHKVAAQVASVHLAAAGAQGPVPPAPTNVPAPPALQWTLVPVAPATAPPSTPPVA